MPQNIGSVNIGINARLDTLERDLGQGLQMLNRFSSNADQQMKTVADSTKKSEKSYAELNKTLSDTDQKFKEVSSSIASVEKTLAGVTVTGGAIGLLGSPAFGANIANNALSLSKFTAIAGAWGIAVLAAAETVEYGFSQAKIAIDEAHKTIDSANSAHLDLSSFIGLQKATEKLNIDLKEVVASFQRLDEISHERLGGDPFSKLVSSLSGVGNFQGNSGVDALKIAQSNEDKWKAVAALLNEAYNKGERLAALDIAQKFLPPDLFKKVEAYGPQILQDMLDKAAKLKPTAAEEYVVTYARTLGLQFEGIDKRIKESSDEWAKEMSKPWLEQPWKISMWKEQISSYVTETVNTINATWASVKFGLLGAPTNAQNLGLSLVQSLLPGGLIAIPDTLKQIHDLTTGDIRTTDDYRMALAKLTVGLGDEAQKTEQARQAQLVYSAVMGDTSKTYQGLAAQIKDKIDLMDFEAAHQGESTQVLTKFRIEQELSRAVRMGNLTLTKQEIDLLSQEYAVSENMLGVSKEINKLKAQTGVLKLGDIGSNELEVIKTLQALFKDDWASFLNSDIAGIMRLNQSLKSMTDLTRQLREDTEKFSVSMAGIGALSPAQKGEQAFRQKLLELEQAYRKEAGANAIIDKERAAYFLQMANNARDLASSQEKFQLSESARMRLLSGEQSIQSAKLELDLVGKSIEAQERLRGELQVRQQVESEAAAHNIKADEQHIAALQKQKDIDAALKQAAAERKAINDAQFQIDTVFLDEVDQKIANIQRSLHSDAWKSFMNDGLSATIRLGEGLKKLQDIAGSFASGFFTDLSHGVSAIDAFKNALGRLSDTLIDMASKRLVANALGATGESFLGSFLGIKSAGSTSRIYDANELTPLDALVAHSGGLIGSSALTHRSISPSLFRNAPRFHLGVDEVPAILQRGEKVIPRGGQANSPMVVQQHFYMDGVMTKDDVANMVKESAKYAIMQSKGYTNATLTQVDKAMPARTTQRQLLGT